MTTRLLGQDPVPSSLEWYKAFFTSKEPLTEERKAHLHQQLQEAIEINDKGVEAHVRKEIGLWLLTRVPDYDSALYQFIRAAELEDSLTLRYERIISYLAMSKVFYETGNLPKSASILETASGINENENDPSIQVYILNEQGKIFAQQSLRDVALEKFQIALSMKSISASDKAEVLFNLGDFYVSAKSYNEALAKHKEALKLWRELKDRTNEARSLNEIGEVYRLLGNNKRAIDNFVAAVEIRSALKDERGLADSYNKLGSIYYELKDYQKAITALEHAMQSAHTTQWAEQSAISHDYLSNCWKELKDFEKALYHRDEFVQLTELILLEKQGHEIQEKEKEHFLKQKEGEISALQLTTQQKEAELTHQRKIKNFLFAVTGLGLAVVLLTLYLYMVKRRANTSLKAAHHRLNEQNVELQNLNATKDKFFSIISHDLKGPLNSFTAFSKMLIDHTDSLTKDEIQMLAREIDKNIKNVYALLENLLEWSRSQTGNIEFKPEPFDLHELLQQNKDLLSAQAANKKISLRYEYAGPLQVVAHKHSVNTVIRNLISNAIKFTPEKGTITLDAVPKGGVLQVSVTDTGVGMSAKVLEKLFRIDTKYSTNGTANEKGTGLGLILCKDFIEKNGGTLGVQSTEGKGSVFYFTLPTSRPPGATRSKQIRNEEITTR